MSNRTTGIPLYLHATAFGMSQKLMVDEAAKKLAERKAASVQPPKQKGPAPLLTDEQILEIRALSQFAGWDYGRLTARYGIDKDMTHRVVSGVTRSRLVALPRHLPAGVAPV